MPWNPCLVCKEETTNYCRECAHTNSDGTLVNARFYCDTDCRTQDELEHIKVHMALYRARAPNMERAIKAGKIAQLLFYAFVENTWAYDMDRVRIVRDQDHELVDVEVTDGPGVAAGAGSPSACRRYAGGWLTEFPSEAFGAFDDDAKFALLADRNSIWGFVVMHIAVQVLFQDLVEDVQTDIKEVVHRPTSKATRIVSSQGCFGSDSRRQDQLYPDIDERGDIKGVYEITLKCGSKIALDLAGAQWNLDGSNSHAAVTTWSDYCSRWGTAIKYRIPFRSHQLKHAAKMSTYHLITTQTLIMECIVYFNIFLTGGCKAELTFTLPDLLLLPAQHHEDAEHLLLTKVTAYLQKRPSDIDAGNPLNILSTFTLAHPKFPLPSPTTPLTQRTHHTSLPLDIGSMANFDWKALGRFIQQPGSEVPYREKKAAVVLKKKRSAWKEDGEWKVRFLEDTVPGVKVKGECVSENPGWKLG